VSHHIYCFLTTLISVVLIAAWINAEKVANEALQIVFTSTDKFTVTPSIKPTTLKPKSSKANAAPTTNKPMQFAALFLLIALVFFSF
jgi:hypothetical protein